MTRFEWLQFCVVNLCFIVGGVLVCLACNKNSNSLVVAAFGIALVPVLLSLINYFN